ncbi:glycerophosphodiester phosphodiesterase domain-containing protein 5 isoform X2 [Tiliqua scincoides]|uniref:glycerophosphodiester phosphodiesterase domain-containing protein 5 isoform X2 n=1 Tax=Tiliqua scincoides TaxID=71010 RepID=UPI0034636403
MVKHQPLQYYEPQLCLSCLTGIYGCRWKRYQRSHDDTTKWERLWFLILAFTFFLTVVWFYFWQEVHNDYNEINWFLYNRMGYWSDWSIPILVTTAAGVTYISALLILALCHIAVGQQLNLHWIHKIGLITTLIMTVITMCSVAQLWDDEWDMVAISLQLAPENTLMSFQKAVEQKVYGVQVDVVLSYDGVPFLMHDKTLRRTTNVEQLFPELAYEHCSMFNWTDLERLNAGEWFLKHDPFWTASSLSASDLIKAANQSVCSLADMLETIKGNATVLLNLQDLPLDHPYYSTFINITLETVLRSGVPQQAVMWLPNSERRLVQEIAPDFQQTSGIKADAQHLRDSGFQRLNLRYTKVTRDEIREYTAANLSVNLYIVNEPWLYSILWCSGVQSVTSDNSQVLGRMVSPSWLMTPDVYSVIWITADLISLIIIVGVFIFQKWRLGSIQTYNPEQIMLSAAVRRSSRDVNIMKEKLIFSEINSGVDVPDELSLCSENGYANEGITPMDHRDVKLRIN